MIKEHLHENVPMLFTAGRDWHLDIFLEANAQVTEISLKVFSHAFPANVYSIAWNLIQQNGTQTQIPIDAAKTGLSTIDEAVHLEYKIVYYY